MKTYEKLHRFGKFKRVPPVLLRLLARKKWGKPLTVEQIADGSGLSAARVEAISQGLNWDGIDLPTAEKFMLGVGVNLDNPEQFHRAITYVRTQVKFAQAGRQTWKYLRLSPDWESVYKPLIERWRKSMQ